MEAVFLPPKAVDDRGFIIDQSQTGGIRFGRRGSVKCGCGWIAAYNLHLWRGERPEPQQVARCVNRISPLSGTTGVNVFCLWLYLLIKGFRPRLGIATRSGRGMGRVGIIMYKVRRGGHYVMYERLDDDRCRYYNAVYGRREHIAAPAEFMTQRSRWPLALVIKVGKKQR